MAESERGRLEAMLEVAEIGMIAGRDGEVINRLGSWRGFGGARRPLYGGGRSLELGQSPSGEPAIVLHEPAGEGPIPGAKMPYPLRTAGDEGVLYRFLRLADRAAGDRAVLRFARQHGILEFCPHGYPRLHSISWLPKEEHNCPSVAGMCTDWARYQPLAWYRREAGELNAILAAGAALERGRHPDPVDWADIPDATEEARRLPERAKREISYAVVSWLIKGGVQLGFHWQGKTKDTPLHGRGLWGVLARQLVSLLAGVGGLARCAGCGQMFAPRRQRVPGKRAWCEKPECRRARGRVATRESRMRTRAT